MHLLFYFAKAHSNNWEKIYNCTDCNKLCNYASITWIIYPKKAKIRSLEMSHCTTKVRSLWYTLEVVLQFYITQLYIINFNWFSLLVSYKKTEENLFQKYRPNLKGVQWYKCYNAYNVFWKYMTLRGSTVFYNILKTKFIILMWQNSYLLLNQEKNIEQLYGDNAE